MENYFQMNLTKQQVDAISNLGLAHMGDCVYEVLCRSYLCARGDLTVGKLHKDTVNLVRATTQADFADKLRPHLTEEELAYYRRGKNSHVHAVPKGATREQYAKPPAWRPSSAPCGSWAEQTGPMNCLIW